MSIRYEVTCDVCWDTWDAADEQTAVYDLQSHLENDHWGHIKEIIEEEEPNKEDQYEALL